MKSVRERLKGILHPRARSSRLTTDEVDDFLPPPPSLTWKQVFSYPPLVLGILIVAGLIAVVWFAPQWASYDPYLITQSSRPYYDASIKKLVSPPFPISPEYPLGTDQWGNDLLTLVLYGARVTLIAGVYITLARILLGTILGLVAGWYVDSIVDRTINGIGSILGSIPVLLSSIILIYSLNIYNGLWVFVVALSAIGWFETARLVRGEVQRIKRTNYIEAARAIGLNNFQILVRHVLPNVTAYLIVITVLETGAVLLLLAELAFLGVFIGGGTRYNDDPFSPKIVLLREVPEWGAMVAQGVRYIRSHPNMVLVPGFAFFISIAGVNALGEGLRWLFTRWPFSIANLLKKRTVVVVAAFVLVSAVILNQTSPQASFAHVSREITAEKIQARVDLLMKMQAESPGDAGTIVADYIADQMKDLGITDGWRSGLHAAYHYDYETVVTPLLSTPMLASVPSSGQPAQAFTYQTDFVLAQDQPMDSISLTDDVLLVNPQAPHEEEWSFDGRVVMTLESLAPVNYSQFVASRGGAGLLLIADTPILTCAKDTINVPVRMTRYEIVNVSEFRFPRLSPVEGDSQPLPTLRITPDAALHLLKVDDLTLDVFSQGDWSTKELHSKVNIQIALGDGKQIKVDNAMGYLGGYDIDNASEALVVYASYDTSTGSPDDMLSAALMLEMVQAWHDNRLDPRRSLILIAWDRANLGSPGAPTFMDEMNNFRLLTPAVPAASTKPIMIWNISMMGALDGGFTISPFSDSKLQMLLANSSKTFHASTDVAQLPTCQSDITVALPALSLMPGDSGSPSPMFVESFGRSISLSVLKILRLPNY